MHRFLPFLLLLTAVACGRSAHTAEGVCHYDSVTEGIALQGPLRATWQQIRNPKVVSLPEQGYPCVAFKYTEVPAMNRPEWAASPDRQKASFSRPAIARSTNPPYLEAEFLYLRTNLYLPPNARFAKLVIQILDLDDSMRVELYNEDHPDGMNVSGEAICHGNGDAQFDVTNFVRKGGLNRFVLTHVDLGGVSSIGSADILLDGMSVPTSECAD